MTLREGPWTQAPLLDSPKAIPAFRSIPSLIGLVDSGPEDWGAGYSFYYPDYDGQEYTVARNEDGFIITLEGPVFDIRSSGRRLR